MQKNGMSIVAWFRSGGSRRSDLRLLVEKQKTSSVMDSCCTCRMHFLSFLLLFCFSLVSESCILKNIWISWIFKWKMRGMITFLNIININVYSVKQFSVLCSYGLINNGISLNACHQKHRGTANLGPGYKVSQGPSYMYSH